MNNNKVDQAALLKPEDEPLIAMRERAQMKKSLLMKSFSDTKDNRGNCAMEQSDFMAKQKLQGRTAMCKLLIVTCISFGFMIAEFVGGYMSGSLAIMTDAAHILSDVAGFLISYFAIYIGTRPANYHMSFGYHRAEILGALASILLIWGLIIYLFIEAIHRMFDPEGVDGTIMLITACVGLVCNIISIFTLHSCGGGHSHHGHSHDEEKNKANPDEARKLSHCHDTLYAKKKVEKYQHHSDMESDLRKHESNNDESDIQIEEMNKQQVQQQHRVNFTASEISISVSQYEKSNSNQLSAIEPPSQNDKKKEHKHNHDHKHDHDHDHKHDHGHKHDDHGHHHHGLGGGHDHSHENMNIRAAVIHILGDIVQSIGVVIAAIIIFFKPEWEIADPICTIIFTILCIFTTVPIFRDIFSVLMEATPKGCDVVQAFQDCLNVEEVEEIHDFHIWSLSVGKLSMSGHIRAKNAHKAMKKVTRILRDKYNIYHTTIQVEKSHPGIDIGCCDNDEKHDHHHHAAGFGKLELVHDHEKTYHDEEHNHKHEKGHSHEHKHEHNHDKHDHKHQHKHDHHHDHDNEHGGHGHDHDHDHDHHDHQDHQ